MICGYKNSLFFGAGKVQTNDEFRIISNGDKLEKEYDYLIFTDSKGNGIEPFFSWTNQLINKLKKNNHSFLLIIRPKEMTIFFSLINFLNLNDIKFKYLITNLGFVDTTPKKREFIDDIFVQNPFPSLNLEKTPLCNYLLNSGKMTTLYNVNYNMVIQKIGETLKADFKKVYFIETFEFSSNIKIKRKRPIEFFKQLKETNVFIKSVSNQSEHFTYIDINIGQFKNQTDLSYDAVHFTQSGHDLVFQSIKTKLNCNE